MNAREKLGLSKDASLAEVQNLWRSLAVQHHPDYGGDAAEFDRFKLLCTAAMQESSICRKCGGSGKTTIKNGLFSISIRCDACKKN